MVPFGVHSQKQAVEKGLEKSVGTFRAPYTTACFPRPSSRPRAAAGAQRHTPWSHRAWTWSASPQVRCLAIAADLISMAYATHAEVPGGGCGRGGQARIGTEGGGGLRGGLTLLPANRTQHIWPQRRRKFFLHNKSPYLIDPPPCQQKSQCKGKPKAIHL